MISLKHILIPVIVLLLMNFSAVSQTKTIEKKLSKRQTWQLLDYERDTVYDTSLNRAYRELLNGKKSQPVIVAVIDKGGRYYPPKFAGGYLDEYKRDCRQWH